MAYSRGSVNFAAGAAEPERLSGGFLSAGAFEQLGIRPTLGRTFRASKDRPGAETVIVIGHDLWRNRVGSSPSVLGRTVVANGVMPERFGFPKDEQLWLPITIDPSLSQRGQGPWYQALGRPKDGVSLERAAARTAAIGARLERDHPEAGRTMRTSVQPLLDHEASLFRSLLRRSTAEREMDPEVKGFVTWRGLSGTRPDALGRETRVRGTVRTAVGAWQRGSAHLTTSDSGFR